MVRRRQVPVVEGVGPTHGDERGELPGEDLELLSTGCHANLLICGRRRSSAGWWSVCVLVVIGVVLLVVVVVGLVGYEQGVETETHLPTLDRYTQISSQQSVRRRMRTAQSTRTLAPQLGKLKFHT